MKRAPKRYRKARTGVKPIPIQCDRKGRSKYEEPKHESLEMSATEFGTRKTGRQWRCGRETTEAKTVDLLETMVGWQAVLYCV